MHGATRMLREIALWVVAVLGTISILVAVAAVAFGVTPLIFRSGSMSPDIPTGALGLAQRTDAAELKIGDVVSVEWSDGTRVTHRIVGLASQGDGLVQLETRGDANEQVDVEHPIVDQADRLFWSLPGAGFVLQEVTKPYWVFGSGVLVGAIVVLSLIRPRPRDEEEAVVEEPEHAVLAPDWPPRGRAERVVTQGAPRHAGAPTRRHRDRTAGLLGAGVLVVSLALLPPPTGTLAAFNDPANAQATVATGAVPNVASVGCAITGTVAKSVVLTWPAATGGLGPITSYRVTGPGVDQVVNGLTVTIPPALLSVGTFSFTVQSRYGTTPWLSTGVSRSVTVVTSLIVNCN